MAGKLTDFEIFKSEVSVGEVCLLTAMQLKRNPARVPPRPLDLRHPGLNRASYFDR